MYDVGAAMTAGRKTLVVLIGNVVYYFVNDIAVGCATLKELENSTQTTVIVEE